MAELKTKATEESVSAFLDNVSDPERRQDCLTVLAMMKDVTGEEPKMWGKSIVGFGRHRYKYESGREGEWLVIGFSPRKNDLTLYLMTGFDPHKEIMERLGKYKTGKSCLYIKKLKDIDVAVLKELIAQSVENMSNKRV